jgi:hypothetical protein
MDGAGAPTRGEVAARAVAAVAAAPRLEAYPRAEVDALVADALRQRAELREALDVARHAALQAPAPIEVIPRVAADGTLSAIEAEMAELRSQLAAVQAQLGAAPVGYAIPAPVVPAIVAPPPMQQVIVERAPFARANGLLQLVIWSVVVAVVLIVLLAWFG